VVGYRSTVGILCRDPLGGQWVTTLTPAGVRATMRDWDEDGATTAVLAARFRVLRSALSWAYEEHLIDVQPLRRMRGPGRVPPRLPLVDADVRRLLVTATTRDLEAEANDTGTVVDQARRHAAELDLLLVRLAADSGARRGELAALCFEDLDGRVLRIERAVSAGRITTPKSGHGRVLTLGAGTAALWMSLTRRWQEASGQPLGPWLFSPALNHRRRLEASTLGHRFTRLRDAADVPHATLHRLRHTVATFLVG
jgi:integrase